MGAESCVEPRGPCCRRCCQHYKDQGACSAVQPASSAAVVWQPCSFSRRVTSLIMHGLPTLGHTYITYIAGFNNQMGFTGMLFRQNPWGLNRFNGLTVVAVIVVRAHSPPSVGSKVVHIGLGCRRTRP